MIFNAYAEQQDGVPQLQIVSCGHIFAKPGRQINRPKGRSDWLLFYVAKESETFFFQERVVAQAGSFVLFSPGEKQHHIYEGDKTAEFYYVHFRCEELPKGLSLHTSQVYQLPLHQSICADFEAILDELMKKQPCYEPLCAYKLLQILTQLQRGVLQSADGTDGSSKDIVRVIHHMNLHYNSDMKLDDYAQMCCMSKYHFLRLFEQATGNTPLKYRNTLRLMHAAELLQQEDDMSVEQIGTIVGYTSAAYFSFAFKKKYGVSPKEYRNR